MSKVCSYKLQYFLALVPFLGIFINIGFAWYNIYKITKKRIYIFLHFLLFIVPLIIFFSIAVLCIFFVNKVNIIGLRIFLYILVSYITFLILAVASVAIERGIIERYKRYHALDNLV
mgnify:CR=1 FL=1